MLLIDNNTGVREEVGSRYPMSPHTATFNEVDRKAMEQGKDICFTYQPEEETK